MELVQASNDLLISGVSYPGFPILLFDNMESCVPANSFFRGYLIRASIESDASWESCGRAIYDYFSFLQSHDLDWRDVDRGDAKSLLSAYRDYSFRICELARETVRQRMSYISKFYEHALKEQWISRLPFTYEDRRGGRYDAFLAHIDGSGGIVKANDAMPKKHHNLPKYLSLDEIKIILAAVDNPHHRMIIRFALQTGLRREEIATFPLKYIEDAHRYPSSKNVRIDLNPSEMQTKGQRTRSIYISRTFINVLYRYILQVRGERAQLSPQTNEPLFLNQFGVPYLNDGKGLQSLMRKIGAKVGVHLYPHKLRHTYATYTLASLQKNPQGIEPLVFVQRQLGHSSIQTTMKYLHLIAEWVDDAIISYDEELNDFSELPHG